MEFLLQQQWYDPRLRYSNRSQYEFLNAIHHYDDIWLPDTYFIMHGDFKDPLIPVHFALRIYRNGTVNYLMRYFPFFLSFVTETFLFSNASRLSGVISSCPARVDSISSHSMTHCVHSRSRAVSERMPCYTRFYAFFVTPSSVFTPTPLFTFFFSIV